MTRKILKFGLGCGCIFVFLFILLPFINKILIPDKIEMIKSRNLDTGALIYSESEEAVEGNFYLLKSK